MNILYINHYAGSPSHGMEFRPYYLSKEWQRLGHKVTILASSYSHVRAKQPIVTNKKIKEFIDGIEYTWYSSSNYSGNGIGRVKNIFSFLSAIWRDTENLVKESKPDVVIASSTYPMDIWVAKRIAKKSGAKLVFEVHDLWPLSPIELGGISPKHPFMLLCQAAENYAYKHADVVVSMLPKVHDHMQKHGLDLKKLVIVPNGIVENDWLEDNIEALENKVLHDFIIECKNQNKNIICYAGSHGVPNALQYFLDAANILRNKEDITFILIGSGLEKENLINIKIAKKLENVYFFDPIPKKQIPSLLKLIDIAYIGWCNVPIYRFGISPNKLMDYMMAGKPIIHSVKAGNDAVGEANCGLTVAPENPELIAQGILELSSLSKEQRNILGNNGKIFVQNNYLYSVLSKKFLEAIN